MFVPDLSCCLFSNDLHAMCRIRNTSDLEIACFDPTHLLPPIARIRLFESARHHPCKVQVPRCTASSTDPSPRRPANPLPKFDTRAVVAAVTTMAQCARQGHDFDAQTEIGLLLRPASLLVRCAKICGSATLARIAMLLITMATMANVSVRSLPSSFLAVIIASSESSW